MAQNIFLLHGKKRATTNTLDNRISRIVERCEENGISAVAPLVDQSRAAYGKDWEACIDMYAASFTEETIFVGHSAGAAD